MAAKEWWPDVHRAKGIDMPYTVRISVDGATDGDCGTAKRWLEGDEASGYYIHKQTFPPPDSQWGRWYFVFAFSDEKTALHFKMRFG